MADIQKLEQELRAINKEREQVEKNWRDIEYKERQTERKFVLQNIAISFSYNFTRNCKKKSTTN